MSLKQIAAFLQASEEIRFKAQSREQVYHWIEQLLQQQQYEQQGRKGRGLLRRYIARMTGLSRAQVTRLIERYREQRELRHAGRRYIFVRTPQKQPESCWLRGRDNCLVAFLR